MAVTERVVMEMDATQGKASADQFDKSITELAQSIGRTDKSLDALEKELRGSAIGFNTLSENAQRSAQAQTRVLAAQRSVGRQLESTSRELREAVASWQAYTRSQQTAVRSSAALGGALRGPGEALTTLGVRVRNLALIFGAGLGLRTAVSTLASFELEMKRVQATARASTEELGQLTQVARELGAATQFTASQVANAELFLARAGFSVQETIAALPGVLALTTSAMELGLGGAADIASNVVAQFGLVASETGRVADALVATANRANTSVAQLAEALKFAGTAAGPYGRQLEETAAALGVLGDRGIQASMAGTNLRAILARLVEPTAEARQKLQELGLSVEDVSPVSNDLATIFERLSKAGFEAADAGKVFRVESAAAATVLVQNYQAVRELEEAVRGARGESERIAAANRDSLKGSFLELQSAIEDLILKTGEEGLTGALRSSTDFLTDMVRLFGDADSVTTKFAGSVDITARGLVFLGTAFAVTKVVSFTGALTGLSTALAAVTTGTKASTGALVAMRAALVANPFGALAAVIGLAAGALTAFNTELADTERTIFALNPAADSLEQRLRSIGNLRHQATADISDVFTPDRVVDSKTLDRLQERLREVRALQRELQDAQFQQTAVSVDPGEEVRRLLGIPKDAHIRDALVFLEQAQQKLEDLERRRNATFTRLTTEGAGFSDRNRVIAQLSILDREIEALRDFLSERERILRELGEQETLLLRGREAVSGSFLEQEGAFRLGTDEGVSALFEAQRKFAEATSLPFTGAFREDAAKAFQAEADSITQAIDALIARLKESGQVSEETAERLGFVTEQGRAFEASIRSRIVGLQTEIDVLRSATGSQEDLSESLAEAQEARAAAAAVARLQAELGAETEETLKRETQNAEDLVRQYLDLLRARREEAKATRESQKAQEELARSIEKQHEGVRDLRAQIEEDNRALRNRIELLRAETAEQRQAVEAAQRREQFERQLRRSLSGPSPLLRVLRPIIGPALRAAFEENEKLRAQLEELGQAQNDFADDATVNAQAVRRFAQQRISDLELEIATLGKTQEAVERLRLEEEIRRSGIDGIAPELAEQLRQYQQILAVRQRINQQQQRVSGLREQLEDDNQALRDRLALAQAGTAEERRQVEAAQRRAEFERELQRSLSGPSSLVRVLRPVIEPALRGQFEENERIRAQIEELEAAHAGYADSVLTQAELIRQRARERIADLRLEIVTLGETQRAVEQIRLEEEIRRDGLDDVAPELADQLREYQRILTNIREIREAADRNAGFLSDTLRGIVLEAKDFDEAAAAALERLSAATFEDAITTLQDEIASAITSALTPELEPPPEVLSLDQQLLLSQDNLRQSIDNLTVAITTGAAGGDGVATGRQPISDALSGARNFGGSLATGGGDGLPGEDFIGPPAPDTAMSSLTADLIAQQQAATQQIVTQLQAQQALSDTLNIVRETGDEIRTTRLETAVRQSGAKGGGGGGGAGASGASFALSAITTVMALAFSYASSRRRKEENEERRSGQARFDGDVPRDDPTLPFTQRSSVMIINNNDYRRQEFQGSPQQIAELSERQKAERRRRGH